MNIYQLLSGGWVVAEVRKLDDGKYYRVQRTYMDMSSKEAEQAFREEFPEQED